MADGRRANVATGDARLLDDGHPQLLRVRRVRAHRLAVAREQDAVVDDHLPLDAVGVQLDDVLPRGIVDRLPLAVLRVDDVGGCLRKQHSCAAAITSDGRRQSVMIVCVIVSADAKKIIFGSPRMNSDGRAHLRGRAAPCSAPACRRGRSGSGTQTARGADRRAGAHQQPRIFDSARAPAPAR